ncbi:MAG TPA: cupin domain-containing protein [Nocardioides sp.]|uniref:cupin domain-containing protein n=1 Tax=uncultured Nocardioides sp. TaxID=198441 RepID=UPI00261AE9E7|nr:cupin domain-containing protein [uncultured Nocardioides sp.]HRD62556.1 cupin domain-containing protein [Nocardioides sp.]HRI95493.1 cupin domain-containing protein [Nocardioides sp.]HRK45354.1 cupin domain-containing protein [Nocardioides sp.]
MKTVADIRVLAVGHGTAVVPEWEPGAASPGWVETEWRGFGAEEMRPYGGGWEGQPGSLRLDDYPYDEVCVMLTGMVALVDHTGARREFGAGEAFWVPRGFSGTWETVEPSTKIFVALPATDG